MTLTFPLSSYSFNTRRPSSFNTMTARFLITVNVKSVHLLSLDICQRYFYTQRQPTRLLIWPNIHSMSILQVWQAKHKDFRTLVKLGERRSHNLGNILEGEKLSDIVSKWGGRLWYICTDWYMRQTWAMLWKMSRTERFVDCYPTPSCKH